MAGLAGGVNPTLYDLNKRLAPDGKIDQIIEVLNDTNEILMDMSFQEGNLPTGNKTTIRTGLPTPTWRALYQGVQPTSSQTAQVTDTCGMLEANSEVDKKLAELANNKQEFLYSELLGQMEGFNQEVASTLFYGDVLTNPEKFHGLAPRYPYDDAPMVIDAGGTGGGSIYTSVWLVVWGPQTCFGIFPKGSKAGLQIMTNDTPQRVTDASGYPYYAYTTNLNWDVGLVVRDWRAIVRICNLATTGTSNVISNDLLIQAFHKIPPEVMRMGRPAVYMNRGQMESLDRAANTASAGKAITLTETVEGGKPVTRWRGIPLRRCDAILETEAELTATP